MRLMRARHRDGKISYSSCSRRRRAVAGIRRPPKPSTSEDVELAAAAVLVSQLALHVLHDAMVDQGPAGVDCARMSAILKREFWKCDGAAERLRSVM